MHKYRNIRDEECTHIRDEEINNNAEMDTAGVSGIIQDWFEMTRWFEILSFVYYIYREYKL